LQRSNETRRRHERTGRYHYRTERQAPLIFKTFDELKKGGDFILTNDHDPKPLYYSFLHEREGQFDWEYLEQGPTVWKVKISKK
jgi:uncharacterized protein (DUF2249 family)